MNLTAAVVVALYKGGFFRQSGMKSFLVDDNYDFFLLLGIWCLTTTTSKQLGVLGKKFK